ncbi:MAG: hypothetical protein C0598_07005 [Marinilabiliales bacterium]|nr:MAG: hypothetical protein C0598_07005 [Marinilabiliales bacterium]
MKKFKLLIIITIVAFSNIVYAQSGINSPYSRYGLGDLHGENVNAQLQGMGGISIGMSDPTLVNPGNPASYGAFDTTAITFEAGIIGRQVNLRTNQLSETSRGATLNYLLVGFPVNKWWKTSFSLMPYSTVSYNVEIVVDMSEYNFSNIQNLLVGSGGINRINWGNAFKIGKNFRAGIDASYIFGNGSRSSKIYFLDSLNIYGTSVVSNTRVSDFIFDYGFQYDVHLKNKDVLTLGLIYANQFSISAKNNYLASTTTGGFYDVVEENVDTIDYRPDQKGGLIVPQRLGFGAVYKKPGSYLVGADIEWQEWSKYAAFGIPDTLQNTLRISVGGQYLPKHTNISSLFKRMTYRLGARYEQSYLKVNGNTIDEFGISFGVSFPMKKSKTAIDLSFEVGKSGTLKDNLIQENFFNINFGISIQENWFYKRKYN